MAVNLGTTTKSIATGYSFQRKIFKTTLGKLILFASNAQIVKYKTSDDNGDTWSAWVTVHSVSTTLYSYDCYMDENNHIYFAVWDYNGFGHDIYFRKLTYNSGSWSVGSTTHPYTNGGNPSITKRSNGDVWIAIGRPGDNLVRAFYSTDDGGSWTATSFAYTAARAVKIIPYSTNIRCIVHGNSKLRIYEYTTVWNAGSDIAAAGISDDNPNGNGDSRRCLGALKVSDSEIYVCGKTATGIKIFTWNGATWDAGTLLTNNATDWSPTISYIDSRPVVVWNETNSNIYYRKWNGSSWDAQEFITNDASTNKYSTTNNSDADWLYVMYTTGAGSPYTIYFDKLDLNPTEQTTILSDTKIKAIDIQETINSDTIVVDQYQETVLSDTKIKAIDILETISSDSKIKVFGDQKTLLSDSLIAIATQKTILSDTKIKAIDIQETILSDSKIFVLGDQKTILSDAKVVIQVLVDFINKINIVKQVLSDIDSKVNTVIQVLSDVKNFINTCKSIISDVMNDIRTKKLMINNITNDIRFMYNWQKAADGTIQSLGKEYIKVYIGGIEQTDADVDSISISKDLSVAHTAIFDLGRAYDATKPTMEATIQIKYNNWILFSGYITQISPAEDPEKIRINCQDEYWKQNKTNVYYHVGHQPTDDKELYYDTLASALTTQHSWTPGVGNFVPQTLDNFAVGKSDAISNLIKEMGNYEWFYDVDGTRKLWTAGDGSIIDLERQVLGENIHLYDVINHSFDESVEGIVNKFRVQMGDKVVQKDNRTRTYTGYNYSSYNHFVTPAWNANLEILAPASGTGYGFDHRNPLLNYSDVFTKYTMPWLNPELSSWSDRYPPSVQLFSNGGYFWIVPSIGAGLLELEANLIEGFTIDYENGILKLNEPMYLYQTDAHGECVAVRAPIVKVVLWKKNYFTYTINPSDNPETDISNPLMFFTDKMGVYPDTIIKDLNLSNLSIQVGYIQHNYATGIDIIIPSWDDTAFARDIADWELSKICDKKIRGIVDITLDSMCFYGIDLSKRIYINGITDDTMNITSITYNISNFTATLTLENSRYYNRTISIESHGE